MHAADLARMIKARDHPQLQRELELGALGFQMSQLGPIVEPLSKSMKFFGKCIRSPRQGDSLPDRRAFKPALDGMATARKNAVDNQDQRRL